MKTLLEEINDLTWWNEINKLKNILKRFISSFIPDAPINGNPFVRQDGEWVEQTAGSGIESITGDFVDNSDPLNPIIEDPRTYKVYSALLSQSGTDAPTAIVLENTLGQTITWSYSGVGAYNSSNITTATQNNLYIQFSHRISSKIASAYEHNTGGASRVNISQIEADLITPVDSLEKGYIEIRIYS